jgi:hypothetical protein
MRPALLDHHLSLAIAIGELLFEDLVLGGEPVALLDLNMELALRSRDGILQ